MKCYYKDPKATEAVLKDGWLLTGDMARMDEDGFIYLVDRKKDVIISGGENIYPCRLRTSSGSMMPSRMLQLSRLPHERLGEIAAPL